MHTKAYIEARKEFINCIVLSPICIFVSLSYTINIQHLLSLVKLLNPRRIHRNVRL